MAAPAPPASPWRGVCFRKGVRPTVAPKDVSRPGVGGAPLPTMPKLPSIASLKSLPWHRVRVVLPFVTIVALMVVLGNASLDLMWEMRALTNAEVARSRALALAVGDLEQYAQTRHDSPYRRLLVEVAAVSALRDARIELEKPFPDWRSRSGGCATRGFRPTMSKGWSICIGTSGKSVS